MTGPRVISAAFGPRPPDGLAADLRALADQVDRGEVAECIAMWVDNTTSEYTYMWGASVFNAIALSAMLHAQALSNARTPA